MVFRPETGAHVPHEFWMKPARISDGVRLTDFGRGEARGARRWTGKRVSVAERSLAGNSTRASATVRVSDSNALLYSRPFVHLK